MSHLLKVTQLGLAEQELNSKQHGYWDTPPGSPARFGEGSGGRGWWAGHPGPRPVLSGPLTAGERREGVNTSVSSDVQSVFKGKTYSQLQVIFQGIEGKIRAGGPNLDMGYWESLLQQLRAHMARAR